MLSRQFQPRGKSKQMKMIIFQGEYQVYDIPGVPRGQEVGPMMR